MDNLIAVPHEDGLQLLKDKLFNEITKFSLVDDESNIYFSADIHSVYFDINGVLTASIIIPKDENFTSFNTAVLLQTADDVTVCIVPTQPIMFVHGIGGEQEVKIAVSGETSQIVFKKDEYITPAEANNIFIIPLIANTAHTLFLQNILIEKGVIDV
jgi:hypothetical protein